MPVKVALIHALAHSMAPINAVFARNWAEAVCMNVLDDSLSADLARTDGYLDAKMHQRFLLLTQYALDAGADGILFTCSAFGSCIAAAAKQYAHIPILTPGEAMISQAISQQYSGYKLGLIASFAPTLKSMPREFPHAFPLECALAKHALEALNSGDPARHDALVARRAQELKDRGCTAIALAQISMARAKRLCEQLTGLPVLTTPDSAVQAVRNRLMKTGQQG